jgi:oligopeptide/dipeptide ABC transporter ATP-binding protein
VSKPVLSVRNLSVSLQTDRGYAEVVDKLSFSLFSGEVVGLVGESGCGKSTTAAALMGLVPSGSGIVKADQIMLGDENLAKMDEAALRRIRGSELSMVFQEPLTALDPVFSIGSQLSAIIRRHRKENRYQARLSSVEMLERVGMADTGRIMHSYPHQLSGGMRQRIMIAMAMACRPRVLIADEPTTALDVTTQALVLEQLIELGKSLDTAILLITHDLGVVAQVCKRALIMHCGKIVEQSTVEKMFAAPAHPYTAGLIAAVPRISSNETQAIPAIPGSLPHPAALPDGRNLADRDDKADPVLLSIRDLVVKYSVKGSGKSLLTAVNGVNFDINSGSIFGLVGESGSGKTSLAHSIMQLVQAAAGEVLFHGESLANMKQAGLRKARKSIQLIFQDPMASLSPRRSIRQSLLEPLDHFQIDAPAQRFARACSALETVGLGPELIQRFPHELSSGQRQRVALARALLTEPELIIADEAVTSLDVSVQARIIELILDLQQKRGIAFLFIAHDLAVVRQLANRVGVMYMGKMVESASANRLFQQPAHPYTRSLLAAVPVPDPSHANPTVLQGEPPSALAPPQGCTFHTRCPQAIEQCSVLVPPNKLINKTGAKASTHNVSCHLWNQ